MPMEQCKGYIHVPVVFMYHFLTPNIFVNCSFFFFLKKKACHSLALPYFSLDLARHPLFFKILLQKLQVELMYVNT